MKKAIAQTKSRNLNHIVQRYRSNSFQYASRNFYAEFIAAKKTYEILTHSNLLAKNKFQKVSSYRLPRAMGLSELTQLTGMNIDTIRDYNLGIKNHFYKNSHARLPKHFMVYVPESSTNKAVRYASK
jgi:membrane-bound lytic murein transglycosylase D